MEKKSGSEATTSAVNSSSSSNLGGGSSKPKGKKRPIINDVNPEITCVLCAGYFVNATTIVDCFHTFCKSCIVKYLESNKSCPICEVPLNKVRPLQSLREDKIRQELVYKVVPHLYRDEIVRRQNFYFKESDDAPVDDVDAGLVTSAINYYKPSDKISMSIEYYTGENSISQDPDDQKEHNDENYPPRRYLLCPAGMPILQLKKFITNKYDLMNMYKVDILYCGEILDDDFSIMDVAYTFAWGQSSPMRFFYRILKRSAKPMPTIGSLCSVQQPTLNKSTNVNSGSDHCKDVKVDANRKMQNSRISANRSHRVQETNEEATSTIRLVKSASTTYEISKNRSSRIQSQPSGKRPSTATETTGFNKRMRVIPKDEKQSALKDAKTQTITTTKPTIIKLVQRPYTVTKNSSTNTEKSVKKSSISTGNPILNASRKSTSFTVNNLIENGPKSESKEKSSFVSISSMIGPSSSNVVSSTSVAKTSKPSLVTTTTTSTSTSSSGSKSGNPLSPPAIRIKLTCSPNHSSSSSSKQLIGQIISPIPPEVAKELSKTKESKNSSSSHKSEPKQKSSTSTGGQRFKSMTSQGVQSSYSGSSNFSRPRGEMIHQIIDKMQSKAGLKQPKQPSTSTAASVSSTTPSFESLINKLSPSNRNTTVTSTDSEVSTTTSPDQPQSRSSGNLVVRISTKKTLETKPMGNSPGCSPSSSVPTEPTTVEHSKPMEASEPPPAEMNRSKDVDEEETSLPLKAPPLVASSSDLLEVATTTEKLSPPKIELHRDSDIDMDDDSIDVERKLVVDMGDSDSEPSTEQPANSDCDSGRGSSIAGSDSGLLKSADLSHRSPPQQPTPSASGSTGGFCSPDKSPSHKQTAVPSLVSPPPTPSPRSEGGSSHSVEMLLAKPSTTPKLTSDNKGKSTQSNFPLDLSMGLKKTSPLPSPTSVETTVSPPPASPPKVPKPIVRSSVPVSQEKVVKCTPKLGRSSTSLSTSKLPSRNFTFGSGISPLSVTSPRTSFGPSMFPTLSGEQACLPPHPITPLAQSSLLSHFASGTPFNALSLLNQSRGPFPNNIAALANSLVSYMNNQPTPTKLKSKPIPNKTNFTRLVSANSRESNVRFVDRPKNGLGVRVTPIGSSNSPMIRSVTNGSSARPVSNGSSKPSKPTITIRKVTGLPGAVPKSTSAPSTATSTSALQFTSMFHS